MRYQIIAALLAAVAFVLLALSVYDGNVIVQQKTLIRQMMHNPACMVDSK